jgi:hypothetical protein
LTQGPIGSTRWGVWHRSPPLRRLSRQPITERQTIMRTEMAILAMAVALAGCGGGAGGGVQAPGVVAGTWGADCSQPYVKFDGGQMTVYPDKATYPLKSADLAGGNLTVTYDSAAGAVSEVYAIEGDTLRLDHGTYAGSEATWHKAPMKKCA